MALKLSPSICTLIDLLDLYPHKFYLSEYVTNSYVLSNFKLQLNFRGDVRNSIEETLKWAKKEQFASFTKLRMWILDYHWSVTKRHDQWSDLGKEHKQYKQYHLFRKLISCTKTRSWWGIGSIVRHVDQETQPNSAIGRVAQDSDWSRQDEDDRWGGGQRQKKDNKGNNLHCDK